MGYRGQNGAQGFNTHGDIQQMAGIEEIVVVAEQGHNRIPDQVQERLRKSITTIQININTFQLLRILQTKSKLTLSVNTTPNFQIWYLMSIDVNL